MDSNIRTLQLVGSDLIADWGELHNAAKTLRSVAADNYRLAIEAEGLVDKVFAQLLSTVNDQLEREENELAGN